MFRTIFKKTRTNFGTTLYCCNRNTLWQSWHKLNILNCLFKKMQSFTIKRKKIACNTSENPWIEYTVRTHEYIFFSRTFSFFSRYFRESKKKITKPSRIYISSNTLNWSTASSTALHIAQSVYHTLYNVLEVKCKHMAAQLKSECQDDWDWAWTCQGRGEQLNFVWMDFGKIQHWSVTFLLQSFKQNKLQSFTKYLRQTLVFM